jgi:glycosyltransferase involved in cell wall biosynthesis
MAMPLEPDRLTLFLPSLRGGGAERVMVNLANRFAAKGRSVDLVLVSAEGPYLKEVSDRVDIVDLGCKRTYDAVFPLARHLRRTRPKAMLATMTHANIIAWAARLTARVPTRLMVREANTFSEAIAKRKGRFTGMIPFLMRMSYRHVDGVIAVSRGVRDDLEALGVPGEKLHVVYSPSVTPDIADRALEPVDHPFLTSGRTHKTLVAVGRLNEQKDYRTLIRTLRQVREEIDVKLVILGEGHLRQSLEDLIGTQGLGDHVSMPGFVDNPFPYMRMADAYVLSSRWEGLPNTLIQAMACGARVISTDCRSGPDEILEGGKWGRLVPVGDEAALAAAIRSTLMDESAPDTRIRAADFSLERAEKGYEELLFPDAAS